MKYIGLDAGSVSVKAVVLDASGNRVRSAYVLHRGHPLPVALSVLKDLASGGECLMSVTGSAGRLISSVLGLEPINEIVAQSYAARRLYPHVRTVIEMGGEDSKLILLGEAGVRDFAMNSVCAAGTGSFLDQQAERLRLRIEELGELSLKCNKPPRIAGRCSVFAKSDMIHLQQIATPVHDIVAGLCFAVARNFKGSIARGRTVVAPVAFQGGVAANKGMVRAFREVFGLDELIVPEEFALTGAIGAALKGIEEGTCRGFELTALQRYIDEGHAAREGHAPLISSGDGFKARHLDPDLSAVHPPTGAGQTDAYMGIDIGSISTNLAVIDTGGRLLAKRYLMTAGRPIEAVSTGLAEIAAELGDRVNIRGVGTTGSGRYMIADYVGADIVKNEITAQATAAAYIDPTVDTIFEIGGQDSKFISLRDGVIVDFEMNKACAAGTGSFLEEQAEKLGISIKGEFQDAAFSSSSPCKLGERCTVFMENSLMANLQCGTATPDLLAGLSYSIVQNYINRVVAGRAIGKRIFFQGGVAFNKSVVAAFEKYIGTTVTVPPDHDVTGAIGMALIAQRHCGANLVERSAFKGFEYSSRPYTVSSFECHGCENLCEINRVQVEGHQERLFYGGRCEKYDIRKKRASGPPDLFAFREELMASYMRPPAGARPTVGIPRIFYFEEMLPYWATLLDELGFDAALSPYTNRSVVDLGLETVLSEACFPVKVALGHVRHLKNAGVDAVLLPSFISMNTAGDEFERGLACPHTQTIPYVARTAVEGLRTVTPLVDVGRGREYMIKELGRAFQEAGLRRGRGAIKHAVIAAERAQAAFRQALLDRGRVALDSLTGRAVVVIGRAYNALDRGMNLGVPEKLATLGVLSIPMDMLPIDDIRLSEDWPDMYWRSGQRVLRAARFVAGHEHLYPIFIGSFLCGPDSFILKYFAKELMDKPYLHLEIDEHSADAGAITRCEAFLDSIDGQRGTASKPDSVVPVRRAMPSASGIGGRTIYIPNMSDHAWALAAAFERAGGRAEVLPESDRRSVELGMRHVSGKECYPCAVTTGDMVRAATDPGFQPERSAFFMPSGSGPCRFGQYNVFHKQVLESIGLKDVPVFAPVQDDTLYATLGVIGKDFVKHSWHGIVATELLGKCLHETRPYEREAGSSDALYGDYLKRLYAALKSDRGDVDGVLKDIRRDFASVPRTGEPRPMIGVIGEIFVRSNRFSNEDLVRKIERLGGEAWLSPVEEWIYYINQMATRQALIKRDVSVIIDTFVKKKYKHYVERRYGGAFEGFLKTLHEPSTGDILKKAAPYVHDSFEGETVLSIGKAVDLCERGASGIVNAMPFGCMPGTIVTALMRGISRRYGVPSISIPYDGTESPANAIVLEAFMDQAKGHAKSVTTRGAVPC